MWSTGEDKCMLGDGEENTALNNVCVCMAAIKQQQGNASFAISQGSAAPGGCVCTPSSKRAGRHLQSDPA